MKWKAGANYWVGWTNSGDKWAKDSGGRFYTNRAAAERFYKEKKGSPRAIYLIMRGRNEGIMQRHGRRPGATRWTDELAREKRIIERGY